MYSCSHKHSLCWIIKINNNKKNSNPSLNRSFSQISIEKKHSLGSEVADWMERRGKQRIERAETAERRERLRNYTDKDDIDINIDIISNQPDYLLCRILFFLLIRDAIVMSILSTWQRPLWTLVPYDSSDDIGECSMTLQVWQILHTHI